MKRHVAPLGEEAATAREQAPERGASGGVRLARPSGPVNAGAGFTAFPAAR